MTKYVARFVPTFCKPCSSLEASKIIPPASTIFVRSPCTAANVPSLMIMSSSSAWRCARCGDSPGFNVVIWHSRFASVGVGASKTERRSPALVGVAFRFAQLKKEECKTGLPAFCANAKTAAQVNTETAATSKSRRVIIHAFRRETAGESSELLRLARLTQHQPLENSNVHLTLFQSNAWHAGRV